MRCEICDRDPRRVYRESTRYYAGVPGDGRGWEVLHVPMAVRAVFALPFVESMQYDLESALIYRVYTCGDDVCMFRAKANGVPGAMYQQPARRSA